ncbi:hypothetical protein P3W45_000490 [Vairimorpha bombi]|jgi:ATP-dependent RNA helicase DDX19/DBP5
MIEDSKVQNEYEVAKELYESIKNDTKSLENQDNQDNLEIQNADKFLAKESFEDMELSQNLLISIYEAGYKKPSLIQKVVIPAIKDKNDVAVQSKSGTGKTIAFVVGMLSRIEPGSGTQAVILSPTRELNMQIYNELSKLTKSLGIQCFLALRDKPSEGLNHEIILGSPGSILSLCTRRKFNYRNLKVLVLDETDVLLDKSTMGSQTFRLLKAFENAQKIYISATYNEDIKRTITAYSPKCISLYEKNNSKPDEIKLYHIDIHHKDKLRALESIYGLLTVAQVIVFVSKKSTVKYLESILSQDMNSVAILHGDLLPEERDEAVDKFKTSKCKILITTDVFSRGMDIPQVNLIINYDLPYNREELLIETYIHRIGRSGRFGRSGFVIDMIGNEKELVDYIRIQESLDTISKGFSVPALEEVTLNEK